MVVYVREEVSGGGEQTARPAFCDEEGERHAGRGVAPLVQVAP